MKTMTSGVSLVLQPIRDRTKTLKGFEALTRIADITDIEGYITQLEQNNQIGKHDRHVLDTVCTKMAAYRDRLGGFFVGVNLSLHTLADPKIVQDIRYIISRHGLRRSDIAFEITETAMGLSRQDWVSIYYNLQDLRHAGHVLLLDDFPKGDPERLRHCAESSHIIKLDKGVVDQNTYHSANFKPFRRYINKNHIILAEGLQIWQHGTAFHLAHNFSGPILYQGPMAGKTEPIDIALQRLPITESWLAAQFKKLAQEGRTFLGERRGVGMGNLGPMVAG